MAERTIELPRLIARLPADTHVASVAGARVVSGIENDSRKVRPGALFVATRGTHDDGHAFVVQAVANGAVAVVLETMPAASLPPGVGVVVVSDSHRALSTLAAAFYGDPSHALDVIGVTGTNGKTTTVHMLQAVLDAAARPCGTIGTLGASFGARSWTLDNTTPLPPELHGLLASMRDAGARAVAMEVSSHALALGRADDVRFRIGVLTNVTRDHLDFHQTLHAYAAAKGRLFSIAQSAVLNAGDECGARWARELAERGTPVVTYAERGNANLVPAGVVTTANESRFTLDGITYNLRLPGRFNVLNALATIAAARELGVDDAAIARGLAQLESVPGRMERLHEDGVDVFVDYAHTPDALEHALQALRETVTGRLAVVFGCGGDRDRGKRGEMGATAAKLADRLYVTSDNPRGENPQTIVDEIVAGSGSRGHVVELDRRRAIERAVAEARPGDAVLVAGKGHETYQIVGSEVLDFDDAAVARDALQRRGAVR
jgi:UDP-N-acetylmuramoyl-L-alanyl-D-glutamate--2,6-diaminopimelate ligase